MTIYTRFGSEVTPVTKMDEQGWIKVKRDDGSIREYHVSDLKADGGLNEIENFVIQSDCPRCNGIGYTSIMRDNDQPCTECYGTGNASSMNIGQVELVHGIVRGYTEDLFRQLATQPELKDVGSKTIVNLFMVQQGMFNQYMAMDFIDRIRRESNKQNTTDIGISC